MIKQSILFFIFLVIFINYGKGKESVGKVLGGEDVKLGELPYMAIIGNGKFFCSGAIITQNHILTGAQCLYLRIGKLNANVRVHIGTINTFDGDVHYVKHILIHPTFFKYYPQRISNDIGILTLCKWIIFDEYKQPVKFPIEEVQNGEEAIMSGWGTSGSGYTSEGLTKVTLKVYNHENCSTDTDLASEIQDSSQFCAIDSPSKGVCNLDQGGPLVLNGKIIGVASIRRGKNCEKGKVIFTSIYETMNFIQDETDASICRNPTFATTVMTRIEDYE